MTDTTNQPPLRSVLCAVCGAPISAHTAELDWQECTVCALPAVRAEVDPAGQCARCQTIVEVITVPA